MTEVSINATDLATESISSLPKPEAVGAGAKILLAAKSGSEFEQLASELLTQWERDVANTRRFVRERYFSVVPDLSGHKTWNGEAPLT